LANISFPSNEIYFLLAFFCFFHSQDPRAQVKFWERLIAGFEDTHAEVGKTEYEKGPPDLRMNFFFNLLAR